MRRVCIITDTNSGFSQEEANSLGIKLVAMPFSVDGKNHYEGISISYEVFFEHLNNGADVTTSQPSPGIVTAVWDKALKTHDEIVYIPMSSALSSSYSSAAALALDYDGRVQVVDNKRISVLQYYSVLDAIKLAGLGFSALEIKEKLESESSMSSIYITVNRLDLLKKSGRITSAAAAVATVLNLKPILSLKEGKLDAYKKARGLDKAKKLMIEAINNEINGKFADKNYRLALAYTGADSQAKIWKKEFEKAFPDKNVIMHRLPISICCHLGDGVLATGIVTVL